MSKILAVFGATGQQGSSVVNYVLHDPELSQKYKIRAITRDVNSSKAQQLKSTVDVVQGDVLDRTSLETALTGVHTIFAMTTPDFGPNALEVEFTAAKTIADVAVARGAEYIIFSTLPSVTEISGGKYTKVTPFDAKAKAETYIRDLPIKSAFFSPGSFMENFQSQSFLAPRHDRKSDAWVMARHNPPSTLVPLIAAVDDTGKFVGAVLASPDEYEGKTFCAATALYSLAEIADTMSKATGQKVVYTQIPLEEFKAGLPFATDIFVEGFSYSEEFGYYGSDTEALVAWAAENARGRLLTLDEYLRKYPLRLG